MSNGLEVIILGIIEGITEFLPISSTGHLLIAEHWIGKRSDLFNIFIQSGAVLAVLFIYWNHVKRLLLEWKKPENLDYLLKLGVSFGITAVLGLVVSKAGIKLPEELLPIAIALLVGGIAIVGVEQFTKKHPGSADITWKIAILVGLAQIVAAIFPGTSRSAACILIAMIAGANRPIATEFSFLVGIPTMFAASAYSLLKAKSELKTIDAQSLLDLGLGFVVSLVVAFLVVKWLLRYVQSHTFNAFALYRIALAAAIFAYLFT
ncbi:MAG: undecaprenyl-diphosphate phosphatase [Verrucomicrobiota bacterium]